MSTLAKVWVFVTMFHEFRFEFDHPVNGAEALEHFCKVTGLRGDAADMILSY